MFQQEASASFFAAAEKVVLVTTMPPAVPRLASSAIPLRPLITETPVGLPFLGFLHSTRNAVLSLLIRGTATRRSYPPSCDCFVATTSKPCFRNTCATT